MSDDIRTVSGRVAGRWDGKDVRDLQRELERIKAELKSSGGDDKVTPAGVPHRDQFPQELRNFNAYPLWGCDGRSCLCGANANRIVSIEDVRRYSLIDYH